MLFSDVFRAVNYRRISVFTVKNIHFLHLAADGKNRNDIFLNVVKIMKADKNEEINCFFIMLLYSVNSVNGNILCDGQKL